MANSKWSILVKACAGCGIEVGLQIDHVYWSDKFQALCKTCHLEKTKVDMWDQTTNDRKPGPNGYV